MGTKNWISLRWLFPTLRVVFLAGAIFLIWWIAGNWNQWTGAARVQKTDGASIVGDLTPLAAKVSGYISSVAVSDYPAQAGQLAAARPAGLAPGFDPLTGVQG